MKLNTYSILLTLLFLTSFSGHAQSKYYQKIRTENTEIRKDVTRSVLKIKTEITLPADLIIESNRSAILTPVLRNEIQEKSLQPITIYGKKREIVSERNGTIPTDAYQILRRKNKTEQAIIYEAEIPFETWMQSVELYLIEDLCGCGNYVSESYERVLGSMIPVYKPTLQASYILPEMEEIKIRVKEASSFIEYPVNQTTLYPDYRNNPAELDKIHQLFDDEAIEEIKSIYIHGFASPEGSYNNNKRLAQGRTETLRNYIRDKYRFPNTIFSIGSTPENWEGFRKMLLESDIDKREEVLAIIDNSDTEDVKEQQLKRLGNIYTYILKEWFPALRRADYVVEYRVPDYEPERAAEIARERADILSMRELYMAANLSEKGSQKYNELIEIAVKTFPDHPVANLNAASMELERGNIESAAKYIQKADQTTGEAYNNLGIIALSKGEFDQAHQWFEKAIRAGISEAKNNLEETNKKFENYQITGEL